MPGAYLSNPNRPAGLSPVNYLNGAKYDGKGRMYCVAPADTNPYYIGDVVALSSGLADSRGIPSVTLATAGAAAVGVIVAIGLNPDGGPYINPNDLTKFFRPTGAQTPYYYALVSDDPNIVYEVQEGGSGTNLTQTAVGKNANILYAAPATGVSVSGTTMNNVGVATTSTLNLHIMGFARRPDNGFSTNPATGGAAQKWWVLIGNHTYRGAGITGV